MSQHLDLRGRIGEYVAQTITKQTRVQQRLREETQTLPGAAMLTTPDQAAFLAMLIQICGAKMVLEIGTYTGYSALTMAMALPENGMLIACDTSKQNTDIAQRYWREAGVENRIELKLGQALDTIKRLPHALFDLAFIDADKMNYDAYYEECLTLLRQGGLLALDNMLWGGAVAENATGDKQTAVLRMLNKKISMDKRVEACLLTLGDGLMLVRKR